MAEERDFILRPSQNQRFRSNDGEAIISRVCNEVLSGQVYDDATVVQLSDTVADEIRKQVKGLNLPNYKYVVQVNICEQRGQAANITAQCVWDRDCDAMASHYFNNSSLWCEAMVFAIFHY